jgi:hypothetical protein
VRPRTEECIIFTIDSGLETPFKILADGLGSGRDRTRGGRRVRQTHWIVTRPSGVSGKERATREAISVAMRNWKVGVWRGDNSGDSGEPGWGQEAGTAGRVDLSQRGTGIGSLNIGELAGQKSGGKWRRGRISNTP